MSIHRQRRRVEALERAAAERSQRWDDILHRALPFGNEEQIGDLIRGYGRERLGQPLLEREVAAKEA